MLVLYPGETPLPIPASSYHQLHSPSKIVPRCSSMLNGNESSCWNRHANQLYVITTMCHVAVSRICHIQESTTIDLSASLDLFVFIHPLWYIHSIQEKHRSTRQYNYNQYQTPAKVVSTIFKICNFTPVLHHGFQSLLCYKNNIFMLYF